MTTLLRLTLVAILSTLAITVAMDPASAQDKPRYGGELTFVVPAEPPTYDGHREGTFALVHPMAPHYNTLLRVDPTDRTGTKVVADLGESWTISQDGGTYTFIEYVKGSHWVGKKNPNYWDKGKPYLDGYRAIFIKDNSAQVAAVRAERAHIQFRGFTPAERDQIVSSLGSRVTVQDSPWDCRNLVTFNHEKKPWDDKRVRRALSLALDRHQGAQALSKIAVVKFVAGVMVPETPYATPLAELEKLAGFGRDINK